MTTARRVAAQAGVSPATVSRVFSRPEVVADGARQRVLAAARELGYRPHPIARSLASGRTGILGVVVPDLANPFFPPLVKVVQPAGGGGGPGGPPRWAAGAGSARQWS